MISCLEPPLLAAGEDDLQMLSTYTDRTKALVAVGARPCAAMHGSAWQAKQSFDAITTGTNPAHRLPGAPT